MIISGQSINAIDEREMPLPLDTAAAPFAGDDARIAHRAPPPDERGTAGRPQLMSPRFLINIPKCDHHFSYATIP
jgi:hypothetical protein